MFTERALADGAAEPGFVIQHKKPEQAGQRVQQPYIPVLKAVKPVTRLVRAHAEQAEGVNVFVHIIDRSEEHTSELQSRENLVCRLLLEKKNVSKEMLH